LPSNAWRYQGGYRFDMPIWNHIDNKIVEIPDSYM